VEQHRDAELRRRERREGRRKKLIEDGEEAFWFFLSTRFGRTVAELKREMSYAEFVHHVAYKRLHPWGDDWLQAGTIAQSAHSAPHVKFTHRSPDKFIPGGNRIRKRQSVAEMKSILFDPARVKIVNGG
jgi:hypothetical protein